MTVGLAGITGKFRRLLASSLLIKAYLETKATVNGVHVLVGGFMSPVFQVWDPQSSSLRYWGDGAEIWEGTSYENAAEFTAAVVADRIMIGIKKCKLTMGYFNLIRPSPS